LIQWSFGVGCSHVLNNGTIVLFSVDHCNRKGIFRLIWYRPINEESDFISLGTVNLTSSFQTQHTAISILKNDAPLFGLHYAAKDGADAGQL